LAKVSACRHARAERLAELVIGTSLIGDVEHVVAGRVVAVDNHDDLLSGTERQAEFGRPQAAALVVAAELRAGAAPRQDVEDRVEVRADRVELERAAVRGRPGVRHLRHATSSAGTAENARRAAGRAAYDR